MSLPELETYAASESEPKRVSGRQEALENIVNNYFLTGHCNAEQEFFQHLALLENILRLAEKMLPEKHSTDPDVARQLSNTFRLVS